MAAAQAALNQALCRGSLTQNLKRQHQPRITPSHNYLGLWKTVAITHVLTIMPEEEMKLRMYDYLNYVRDNLGE